MSLHTLNVVLSSHSISRHSTEEAWDQSHSPLQWRPPPCLSHHKRSYDVSRNTHLPAATNILYTAAHDNYEPLRFIASSYREVQK